MAIPDESKQWVGTIPLKDQDPQQLYNVAEKISKELVAQYHRAAEILYINPNLDAFAKQRLKVIADALYLAIQKDDLVPEQGIVVA